MRKYYIIFLIGPLLGAFFLVPEGVCSGKTYQGFYFEAEVTVSKKVGLGGQLINRKFKRKIFWTQNLFRVDYSAFQISHIIDLRKNRVYFLDRLKKEYEWDNLQNLLFQKKNPNDDYEFHVKTQRVSIMKKIKDRVTKQAHASNPNVKTFMNKIMEKQIGRYMGKYANEKQIFPTKKEPEYTIKYTDKNKTIAGYRTEELKIYRGKERFLQAYVTKKIGPQKYFSNIAPFVEQHNADMWGKLDGIQGFPLWLKFKIFSGDQKGSVQTVEVIKIEAREIPYEKSYEIPKGYTEKKSAEVQDDLGIEVDESEETEEW